MIVMLENKQKLQNKRTGARQVEPFGRQLPAQFRQNIFQLTQLKHLLWAIRPSLLQSLGATFACDCTMAMLDPNQRQMIFAKFLASWQ